MSLQFTQSPFSLRIAHLPKDFGAGRLRDDYLLYDNLNGEEVMAQYEERSFPIKIETFATVMVLQGEFSLIVNLQPVDVKAGQVLVLMPGCIFQDVSKSPDFRFCCLFIEPELTDKMRKNLGIHLELTRRYYSFALHTISQEALANGLAMYKLIKAELSQPDYTYKKEVIQRYCEIWVLKNSSFNDIPDQPEVNKTLNRKEQIFHDFLTLLEEHYTRERSISFYADRMCLTPKYLSTIIKEVSGKHGLQWIDDYVALEAKALLHRNDLSVKQVSDQLNFPSQSMFGRFFKKMTGYSPKQYKLL